METAFEQALVAGVEQLTAWSELLDEINIFPVADGDTGRNLVLSLAPLRRIDQGRDKTIRELLLAARGNSGNIAARFLSGLLLAESSDSLGSAIREGRDRAWQAVADPQPGTILSVFDALVDAMEKRCPAEDEQCYETVLDRLEGAVAATVEALPRLREAGVVDAGALGGYLFFRGFFGSLGGNGRSRRSVTQAFAGHLRLAPAFAALAEEGSCIDMVLEVADPLIDPREALSRHGDHIVVMGEGATLKVHLHTRDHCRVREQLASLGKVVSWSSDDLATQTRAFQNRPRQQAIHILTDAAGSLTRQRAAALGVTLLDSYITLAGKALPETHVSPDGLYAAMARGERISTSQASLAERHALYRSVWERYPQVLYLCVGSVYTGNYRVATQWQQAADREGRFHVIDSGAASGRLGLLAIAAARKSCSTDQPEAVIRYVQEAQGRCEELIFLDQLKFLAVGGRISSAGAWAGDWLRMKPVISPCAEGARPVGLVRDRSGQRQFALKRLAGRLPQAGTDTMILLEYTDNADWVKESLRPEIVGLYPEAEVLVEPMSLTSGVHMGPGTWALAFLTQAGGDGEGMGR